MASNDDRRSTHRARSTDGPRRSSYVSQEPQPNTQSTTTRGSQAKIQAQMVESLNGLNDSAGNALNDASSVRAALEGTLERVRQSLYPGDRAATDKLRWRISQMRSYERRFTNLQSGIASTIDDVNSGDRRQVAAAAAEADAIDEEAGEAFTYFTTDLSEARSEIEGIEEDLNNFEDQQTTVIGAHGGAGTNRGRFSNGPAPVTDHYSETDTVEVSRPAWKLAIALGVLTFLIWWLVGAIAGVNGFVLFFCMVFGAVAVTAIVLGASLLLARRNQQHVTTGNRDRRYRDDRNQRAQSFDEMLEERERSARVHRSKINHMHDEHEEAMNHHRY